MPVGQLAAGSDVVLQIASELKTKTGTYLGKAEADMYVGSTYVQADN